MEHVALQNCTLFEGFDESELSAILGCLDARHRQYIKGDFIFRMGDKPTQVGVVLEGDVHLIQEDYWGNRMLLEQISAGGIFGEAFACAEEDLLPLSGLAARETSVLFIDYKRIINLCSSACGFHLKLIKNMVSSIAHKNVGLMRKIEHTSKRGQSEKILSYLSTQAILKGSPTFEIPFSRQELADYLAIDRASLSRSLGVMKEEGLLVCQGRKFTLLAASA